jgi:pyruvate/2-oxoglutarate dehydrogenase complex dihydrolipoamide acyltransferase (E2) component
MQGTVIKVAVSAGQQVAAGDLVLVLEAMKMEQPVNAHKAGTITGLTAQAGATIASGAAICEIKDLQHQRKSSRGRPERLRVTPSDSPASGRVVLAVRGDREGRARAGTRRRRSGAA